MYSRYTNTAYEQSEVYIIEAWFYEYDIDIRMRRRLYNREVPDEDETAARRKRRMIGPFYDYKEAHNWLEDNYPKYFRIRIHPLKPITDKGEQPVSLMTGEVDVC